MIAWYWNLHDKEKFVYCTYNNSKELEGMIELVKRCGSKNDSSKIIIMLHTNTHK